ncbi:trihelix transcription factor PTL isoform X2 [Vicia villosa]|uniref:trihelix transcription factor PTL isoform X2 n=1 Tax=Vicia villosa TaxID=3911 RepID=UPI00273CA91C|nr:trihelix transcription factor PTL isoform X2 [Vicia villosa]
MEMEDHNHNHHHHHQHYGTTTSNTITDLTQLITIGQRSTTSHFPTAELFPSASNHPNLAVTAAQQQYEMMMFGRQVADIMPRSLHDFVSTDSAAVAAAATTTTTSASTPSLSGNLEAETTGCIGAGGSIVDASTGRWPRQETLTLLEIRSRLDPQFKEATQKGPLWDQLSRMMCEEHGYQRSGKKCREKFENLYKYYKKTKEGKAGRQDGKHYRFFRQLEALYGENNNPSSSSLPHNNFGTNNKYCDSLSLTNSTEFDTSSSDNDNDHSIEGSMEKRKKKMSGKSFWKVKIKDFIDSQVKKLVEKQEEWLEKLTKTLEQKEKERVLREEEWREQEKERLEKEHNFWAKERAWIEARDAALMEALQKLKGNDETITKTQSSSHHDGNKKRKENTRGSFYFDSNVNNNVERSCLYNNNGVGVGVGVGVSYCDDQREVVQTTDGSNSNNVVVAAENCFPFLMGEGGNLWDNYSMKVNKPNQNQ